MDATSTVINKFNWNCLLISLLLGIVASLNLSAYPIINSKLRLNSVWVFLTGTAVFSLGIYLVLYFFVCIGRTVKTLVKKRRIIKAKEKEDVIILNSLCTRDINTICELIKCKDAIKSLKKNSMLFKLFDGYSWILKIRDDSKVGYVLVALKPEICKKLRWLYRRRKIFLSKK